jgi:hypothetical protein
MICCYWRKTDHLGVRIKLGLPGGSRPCKIHFKPVPSADLSFCIRLWPKISANFSNKPAKPLACNRHNKRPRSFLTIIRSSQRMLYLAAHSTACSASPSEPLRWHLSIRWSAFRCPMIGSIAWRRLISLRSSSVSLLSLPRCLISMSGLSLSTPR